MVFGLISALLGGFALARPGTVHINDIPVTDAKGPAVGLVGLGFLLIVYGARARARLRPADRESRDVEVR